MTPATSSLNAPRGLVRRWGLPAGTAGPGSLLDAVLAARGWTDLRDTWFSTGLRFTELEAPYLRDDFVAAAEVILAAIAAGRRIAIYGDYDADGLTATAILFHAIRAIEPGLVPRCYIPHRRQEGYGLHLQALRTLRAEGIDLVVTVDCGIVAVDEVAAARAEGLSIVITDHHAPRADGRLPEADAIVHPRLPGREHRSPDGCGALVAWKLAWTLFVRRTGSPDSHELPAVLKDERARLSALAAIGTVADLMPLLGENRELVRFGIRNSTRTGIEGLDALWRFGDISSDGVTAEAIAYRLAPRLNAAGRLGSAEIALRLLTAETDPRRCRELVRQLDELNKERKRQEHEAFEQALAMLRPAVAAEREAGRDSPDAIVLSDPRWNAGLVGIVCSRLLERFGCPVLLFEETDDGESVIAKGSGRAPPGFDLLQAIETSIAVSGIQPRKWGGHAAAAGMTLERRDLERFAAAFRDVASRHRTFAEFTSGIAIDLEFPPELPPELLSIDAIRELDRLEPFGRDNPRPTLLLRDVRITAAPQAIGREASHLALKLRLGKAERSSAFFEARWWRGAVHAPSLAPGMRCDAVVTPRIDRFRGETRVMLEITDLAPL